MAERLCLLNTSLIFAPAGDEEIYIGRQGVELRAQGGTLVCWLARHIRVIQKCKWVSTSPELGVRHHEGRADAHSRQPSSPPAEPMNASTRSSSTSHVAGSSSSHSRSAGGGARKQRTSSGCSPGAGEVPPELRASATSTWVARWSALRSARQCACACWAPPLPHLDPNANETTYFSGLPPLVNDDSTLRVSMEIPVGLST